MKIAIVHDALCVKGGAERVVLWLAKAFPDAPIYTSVYLPDKTYREFTQHDIRTLPFSKLVRNEKQFKQLFLFWLFLIRRNHFDGFDVVLSSSTYLAKYIKPAGSVRHYCYLYAPFRFIWDPASYQHKSLPFPGMFRKFAEKIAIRFRKFDIETTRKIDKIATSCQNMGNRIQEIYGVDASIIYPPIQLSDDATNDKEDYFLIVSRLIYHKRIDIAIEAFNRLGKHLVIVGDGPEKINLEKIANDNIKFIGAIEEDQLKSHYRKAKALVFTSNEDFGIVPLEAQACGTPVIAYGNGGVLETVKEGVTGIFFAEQTCDSLLSAIDQFMGIKFDAAAMLQWVSKFSDAQFIKGIREFVLDEQENINI